MDIKQEILLGSEKNIDSINVDSYGKIELTNNTSVLTEFTVNDVVNSTEVFDAEREQNQVYRIYGRIEWMSLLNGLKAGYSQLEDYFNPVYASTSKNLIDSFDFYLVAPATGVTYGSFSGSSSGLKKRSFQVIAGKDDFIIYNAGFTNNVYGEQVYGFNFKSDFDVSEYYDKLGFPLTELFLYAQYKPSGTSEQMSRINFLSNGTIDKVSLTTKDLSIGDIVENHQGSDIQDIIFYDDEEYLQEQRIPQTFYIRTSYYEGFQKWLEWSYNPFIPFRLRYLDGVVSTAKLAEIVASTSTLDVYMVNTPSQKLNATKTLAQTLTTSISTIRNWDSTTPSSPYNWSPSSGEVEFNIPVAFEYDITFTTQIYLPTGTDMYIAEIYLEDYLDVSSDWEEIPDSRRKFLITNSTQTVHYRKQYIYGDRIRVRTRLIPNPDKRTMFIIPDYATMITNKGKYVWRDILPQGYVDPITNLGVDYPFFNKRRYLFEPIVFEVIPNLSTDEELIHENTRDVFAEIYYTRYASSIDDTPSTDLDDIEKPCQ